MSETNIDYSGYPFKVTELKQLDWDGLNFDLHFDDPQSKKSKSDMEKVINDWFNSFDQDSEKSPHFLSGFRWSQDSSKVTFWIDFGNTPISELEKLLANLASFGNQIKELKLGRNPTVSNKVLAPDLMPLEQVGIDPQEYPLKILALWQSFLDTPFTIIFSKTLTETQKEKFESLIYEHFTKDAESIEESKYFMGIKWVGNERVAWWTHRFPLNHASLDPLFESLIPHKDLIKALVIGIYLNSSSIEKYL